MRAIFEKDPSSQTDILAERRGNRFWITLNRPKRYNAFTSFMYIRLRDLLVQANEDNRVKFIVINGSGGSYSSGNDLANFTNPALATLGDT